MWGLNEFYFGLNIGYANATTSWCTEAELIACPGPDTYSGRPTGVVEGGQFGYRWQMPNTPLVLGTEIMFDGLDISTTTNGVAVPEIGHLDFKIAQFRVRLRSRFTLYPL